MHLCVYRGAGDVLLFVPEPCLPPREAEQSYGPLRLHARIWADTSDRTWASIVAQIDRHLFAVVEAGVAASLLRNGPVGDAPAGDATA